MNVIALEINHFSGCTPHINRLPFEVLSNAFSLVEKTHRHARLTSATYSGFQDIATLWTYIFISHPGPHKNAELYLSRSGTHPIHVDIIVNAASSRSHQDVDFLQALEFIASNGGLWSRWGSLTIFGGSPPEHINVVEQTRTKSMPNLRLIYLQPKPNRRFSGEHAKLIDGRIFKQETHPQLSSVVLLGLPCSLAGCYDESLVSGLRRLELACNRVLYKRQGLVSLLSSSTQLESLRLDTGFVGEALNSSPFSPHDQRVLLPSLRTLSLDLTTSVTWGLVALHAIDAPAVESFQLTIALNKHATSNEVGYFQNHEFQTVGLNENSTTNELAYFIASGRLGGALQDISMKHQAGAGPIFPYLRTLVLSVAFQSGVYAELLKAYPGVTKATLDTSGIELLSLSDKLLPNLTHLRCANDKALAAMAAIKNAVKKIKDWCMQLSCLHLVTPAGGSKVEGRKTAQKVSEDFGYAMRDGLTVWKLGAWLFGSQELYDSEDYSNGMLMND